MKFLKTTSFWSLIVAIVAVSLSQLPPVKDWVKHESLIVKTSEKFGIAQAFGVLGFNLQLDLANDGNTPINAQKIRLNVVYPSGKARNLVAESYYSFSSEATKGGQPISYPITSIKLDPGQVWSEMVTFGQDFSPQLEEEMNSVRLKISQDIFKAQQNIKPGQWAPPVLLEASADSFALAKKLFEKNCDLEKGEYLVEMTVNTFNDRQIISKKYRFTLYDYHVVTIRSQVDDYKYGANIMMPGDRTKDVWVRVQEL